MTIRWFANKRASEYEHDKSPTGFLSRDKATEARQFMKGFTEYDPTPLHSLNYLSYEYKVKNIWIKDESHRFGLNAFKVLGGAFAIGNILSKMLGVGIGELDFDRLGSAEIKDKIGRLLFVTATDGNHGRGIAWSAKRLGQKSAVFMPKGSAPARAKGIESEGAKVFLTDLNYDDTVEYARKYAQKNRGILVQDTAREGYEEIPAWIMTGYTVMAGEIEEQLRGEVPTHIFLQAGVGSFAASIVGYFAEEMGKRRPVTIIMEPDNANCLYQSALANDGNPRPVGGDLETIMAGLSCGVPNPDGWAILRDYAHMFVSCPDHVAARGVRLLANPLKGDPHIISGESGAVGPGLFSIWREGREHRQALDLLGIDKNSKILFISTEGDTDPVTYRRILWDGYHPYRCS